MANQWERFVWWLGLGQNATALQAIAAVLGTAVTILYAFLTYRIMKATIRQVHAALQPVVAIYRHTSETNLIPTLMISNSGERPVVFLDVVISCVPRGHERLVRRLSAWDEQILAAGDHATLALDFSKHLTQFAIRQDSCALQARLVISDLSRQAVLQYNYAWVNADCSCKLGLPFQVRWHYLTSPFRYYYHRFKYWLKRAIAEEQR
jgi:hypothetical protein